MNIYLLLFYEFFKTGLFAIGGGPATLPFLIDISESYNWYTLEELSNMIAISEGTPGPLGINMATYAGYHTAGILGGLTATFALVLPSIVIIIIIAKFLENFSQNKYVKGAFYGIRPAVAALIAAAVYNLFQIALFVPTDTGTQISIKAVVLCIVVFALMQIKRLKKLHPVVWLIFAAVVGIIFQF